METCGRDTTTCGPPIPAIIIVMAAETEKGAEDEDEVYDIW